MTQININTLLVIVCSVAFTLIAIPVFARWSSWLGLLDKPDQRKVHQHPTPVIGGICIMLATSLALFLSPESVRLISHYPVMIGATFIMFLTGVWDDRTQVKPIYRLWLQLACAMAVASSGIRLESLHGFLGIGEISTVWQYVLTVLVITGSANAFNLIDGIDGLAGGLALINWLILSWLSHRLGLDSLMLLFLALSGSTAAFLYKNRQPAHIFMGDGGSMSMGFLMPVAGLAIIRADHTTSGLESKDILLLVFCTLVIPVMDSLRVYTGRLRTGRSPFTPDKTHVHHLFLLLGWNHRKISLVIYGLEILVLAAGLLMNRLSVWPISILVVIILFLFVCQLLALNRGVSEWQQRIRKMENEQ